MNAYGTARRLKLTLASMSALGLMAAAACAPPSTDEGGPGGGKPKAGGTLTYAYSQEDRNVDLAPETQGTSDCCIIGPGSLERFAIYDALVVIDKVGELEYRLAESLEGADRDWSLVLKPDMKFSDGTPFDAEAVKATWERWATDPSVPDGAKAYAQIFADLEVADPITLKIRLAQPNNQFPSLLAQTVLSSIPSPTAVAEKGEDFGMEPVGAGAFVLDDYRQGFEVTLRRNDSYPLEPAYLDGVVIKFLPDPSQRFNTIQAGGADAAFSTDWADLIAAKAKDLSVELTTTSGGEAFVFNTDRPPFDDLRARQAVRLIFDSKKMNEDLYQGEGIVADSLFADNSPYHRATDVKPDAARAQELIDELGGLHFNLVYTPGSAHAAQGQWFQAQVAEFEDASVELQTIPDGGPLVSGNFDATLNAAPRFVDPYPQLAISVGTDGGYNFGRYSNPDLDAAIREAQDAPDIESRKVAYSTVDEILTEDIPRFFFIRVPAQQIFDPSRVGSIPVISDGMPDLARAWMK